MPSIDLNLLVALEALLAEGSVTGAAQRMGLSPSAMSRTLTRLRAATGDPLLVQAGRSLVATPHAEGLHDRVREVAREARAVLSPNLAAMDPASLDRTFTIRTNEGFATLFAATLVAAVTAAASKVHLRFLPKPDKDAGPLRDGRIDLDIGVVGASAPEVRSRLIFRDRFVGAVRTGHPLLTGPVTPVRYAACLHVVSSRKGASVGPVDDALRRLDLKRRIVVTVPGFPDALAIARRSDLIALVPRSCFASADPLTEGLTPFELPVASPGLEVAAMWHPRLDNDPAHRWLRETVIAACRRAQPT
ncbi:LysR family transcriptional regulator [Methylobacterium sp. J-077]|uniref:LysR family transcriptional regulator n=1 Tax=Methylobacterium sp. J-077 TaxID=2836656 RepID=UPI001FBB60AA|nr:LysR family transcriptional regulator [Methylobacterium sp. J-077]MCJ2124972.1 LysR family transcriptional regulator [Methylobacterium sp. J-077]